MAETPFFQFYPGDYLAKTQHLTTTEHGAYILLLMAAWGRKDCGLPDDDQFLARTVGLSTRKWKVIRPSIMEFWDIDDGYIYNSRLSKDRKALQKRSQTFSESGVKGAAVKKAKSLKSNGAASSHPSISKQPPLSILEPELELDKKKEKIPKRKCKIPDDFPDEKSLLWADSHFTKEGKAHLYDGLYELYRDQSAANSWRYADWPAAFRNFCKNQIKWDKGPSFQKSSNGGFVQWQDPSFMED